MTAKRAVFLDRDGVINELVPDPATGLPESPLEVNDVELLSGVADSMQDLAAAGFLLVGASNQPAAAKGLASRAQLAVVQERVLALLAEQGASFDDFLICPHHPDSSDPELGGPCDCRKPAAGMLRDAAAAHQIDLRASWMIGDSDTDVEAGTAAGARTVLVEHAASAHKRGASSPTLVATDLPSAAAMVLATDGR
jgi:D-glycero-D-manno-heptose 1,7-bisphosphate phosphatase